MGEVLNHRTAERLRRQLVLLVGPVLLLAGGCASSAPPSAPAAPLQESAVAAPAAPAAPEAPAVEIASIELREGAPDASLVVDAGGPLVWTGYRNARGGWWSSCPTASPAPRSPQPFPAPASSPASTSSATSTASAR